MNNIFKCIKSEKTLEPLGSRAFFVLDGKSLINALLGTFLFDEWMAKFLSFWMVNTFIGPYTMEVFITN
ncbi:hypothetical protein A8F95_12150 [Bacillus wudalianchiensis]|uniref:Uncharacterized protein n=1 Tax=Pseudobacillus wudalianchiensis TaxID=1743143 RepID=A0A1B9AIT2_9BACI|nr:hypothetical protein A8F95_12150 [Bacillus wudalianchiensis]